MCARVCSRGGGACAGSLLPPHALTHDPTLTLPPPSPPQAAALARNEQTLIKAQDEIDEVEEQLCESIADAIADRAKVRRGEDDGSIGRNHTTPHCT